MFVGFQKKLRYVTRITKWLKTHVLPAAKKLGTDINLLFLDDEADHASLNLELTKKKPDSDASRINKEVRILLNQVERKAYIGFTASPFANMFVPPKFDLLRDDNGKQIPTLYPRDFIHLLPEPKGYFGLNKLCPGDEQNGQTICQRLKERGQLLQEKYREKGLI